MQIIHPENNSDDKRPPNLLKRIGLFGGTFNPIHFGHLRAAQEVLESFALDKIIFIPSAVPPHKQASDLADAEDRLAMIRLATQNCPQFEASDVEIRRSGHSYTIDTVRYFRSLMPDSRLYFMIGSDAFWEIDSWKSYKELFLLISFIIMTRPGSAEKYAIGHYLKTKISQRYCFSESENVCIHPEKQPVFGMSGSFLDISSTQIRALIYKKKSIRFLVPEDVGNFIARRKLFKS